ncbi:MAG TPA: DUF1659 domain-containing protein [Synergistales bacterium]|nr:DUF1659 domain-containing protein [Synergistales bacterium]
MATFQPVESKLVLKLQTGTDEWGRPQVSSQTIRGINSAAIADSVQLVASALEGLLAYPLYDTQKQDTDSVLAV